MTRTSPPWLHRQVLSSLRVGEPAYPERLLELRDPPPELWLRGTLPPAEGTVGIVGSRRASEQGRQLAEGIARGLAQSGVAVISGGALGIDIAAHRGALGTGAATWVVLPTPVDRPGPAAHRRDFEAVLQQGGGLLSEQAEPAPRHAFCTRNRIIAALSDLVLVVEARRRSGTRYTVDAALRLGRPVAAVPWGVGDLRGEGCLDILRGGAHTITSARDVLALLGREPAPSVEVGRPVATPLDGALLKALGAGPRSVEELAHAAKSPVAAVLVRLTTLELEGVVRVQPGGRFAVVGA